MSEKRWTQGQQDAISSRNGAVLVSAAAGSGKTAVLVQRVIERLTDPNNPCDADRLLVVTFTTAAAAEMKERISTKIAQMLDSQPNNYRLQRQQILLANAHISTIHSFCSEFVRENFYKLNISPNFRIASSEEMNILRDEAVQEALESMYDEDNKDFNYLVECFISGRDDRALIKIIFKLYDFIRSHPFPDKWLKEKAAMYQITENLAENPWGTAILNYTSSVIDYCISIMKNAIVMIEDDETIANAYKDTFLCDLNTIASISECLKSNSWDSIRIKLLNTTFDRLKTIRKCSNDDLKARAKSIRDEVKSKIKALSEIFIADEQECISDISQLSPVVLQLFELIKRFDSNLNRLKNEKNVADFGDLEHRMLSLLVEPTKDGFKRTEDAIELSNKFDEVMVDEYQDTNETQDMIFRAVSQDESNLFVVGDVKQSIYSFRQAMPEIFIRRRSEYNKYDRQLDNYPAKITLDKNFRSRKGVTSAVNFVFNQLMSTEVGDIQYDEDERLVAAADYPHRNIPDTSLHIIDLSRINDDEDVDIIESRYIADVIMGMISNECLIKDGDNLRKVTYKDFCILIRNSKHHADLYAKELNNCGVPAWSDTSGSFFGSLEIATIISILRVIDNPIQDIPILSALMSPIFAFTPDDISDIRLLQKDKPIYFAVKKAADNGNQRCKEFIHQINEYRHLSATVSVDRLISTIYERTGYLAMVQTMRQPEVRVANLRLLLEHSRNYQSSGNKGLCGFIRFIDKLEEQKNDLAAASSISESANVVKVMSIHRSKGLEFPICIVAGCSRKFNKEFKKENVILHPHLGLGIKLRDTDLGVQYTTIPREAIMIETERTQMSEELRVLYVAMTRAKENLIIVTSLKEPEKVITNLASKISDNDRISPYVVRSCTSFSDLILSCAIRHPSGGMLRKLSGINNSVVVNDDYSWDIKISSPIDADVLQENEEITKATAINAELLDLFTKRLTYKYIAQELKGIPSKLAASELSVKNITTDYSATSRPSFMMGEKLTPAEKGTALHTFLQFADYSKAAVDTQKHLEYLIEKGFISKDQGNAIDMVKLQHFFSSSLVNRMLASNNIMREYRFTVNISAGELNKLLPKHLKDELVVLQGAVDCIFEEDGELVIVDYKTDKIKSEQELLDTYYGQLKLYKDSMEKCIGKPVKECLLYSFSLEKDIKVI